MEGARAPSILWWPSGGTYVEFIIKLIKWIDALSERVGRAVSWIAVALVALTVYEVITRRFFGRPTIWTHEVLAYVFGAHFMLAFGYTLLHHGHVNVDVVISRLPERARAVLDIILSILFLGAFVYVFIKEGTAFAQRSWAVLERAPTAFNSPVYPAKTLIPVGAVLLGIQAVSNVLKNVVFLAKGVRL